MVLGRVAIYGFSLRLKKCCGGRDPKYAGRATCLSIFGGHLRSLYSFYRGGRAPRRLISGGALKQLHTTIHSLPNELQTELVSSV